MLSVILLSNKKFKLKNKRENPQLKIDKKVVSNNSLLYNNLLYCLLLFNVRRSIENISFPSTINKIFEFCFDQLMSVKDLE